MHNDEPGCFGPRGATAEPHLWRAENWVDSEPDHRCVRSHDAIRRHTVRTGCDGHWPRYFRQCVKMLQPLAIQDVGLATVPSRQVGWEFVNLIALLDRSRLCELHLRQWPRCKSLKPALGIVGRLSTHRSAQQAPRQPAATPPVGSGRCPPHRFDALSPYSTSPAGYLTRSSSSAPSGARERQNVRSGFLQHHCGLREASL